MGERKKERYTRVKVFLSYDWLDRSATLLNKKRGSVCCTRVKKVEYKLEIK